MNHHAWGRNGCKCHVYCSQCGAQARTNEKQDAPPCTDERRAAWKAKQDKIASEREARFNAQ